MSGFKGSNRRFGVVIFDDDSDPISGWSYALGDESPKRISTPDDLSTGVIWWSNINYQTFFKKTEIWRKTWLRHDKYLVVTHTDVLREWNYDPKEVPPDFICRFVATLFDRIMHISYDLVRQVDPRKKMDQIFMGRTLREDLRCILPEPEYPKSEAASIMQSGQAFEEFTVTGMRPPKDSRFITLRKPRILYALEMLQTPVPKGPFEYMSRADMRKKGGDRVSLIRDMSQPAMVELSVERMAPEMAPVYGFGNATNREKRSLRSWVSHPEFHVLHRLAEIDVKSAWVGDTYSGILAELPDPVKDFLNDKYHDTSWSAGIIAETIWRAATLKEEGWKSSSLKDGDDIAHTSWQGAWLKGADKVSMFLTAFELAKLDYAVLSYGLGWVRCGIQEYQMKDFLNDGLQLGLVPSMKDVPDGLFEPNGGSVPWTTDARSRVFAHFTMTKTYNLLWNLDRVPTLQGKNQKRSFLEDLLKKHRQGIL